MGDGPWTTDRDAGERFEEGLVLDDRGPGGDNAGDPTTRGIRYVTDAFRGTDAEGSFSIDLSKSRHISLDQLVHGIAENSYMEITRTGILVDSVIVWTDSGKTDKIREVLVTRTGILPSQVVVKQYGPDGSTVVETLTYTLTRTGIVVTSIDVVKS